MNKPQDNLHLGTPGVRRVRGAGRAGPLYPGPVAGAAGCRSAVCQGTAPAGPGLASIPA